LGVRFPSWEGQGVGLRLLKGIRLKSGKLNDLIIFRKRIPLLLRKKNDEKSISPLDHI